MSDMKLASAGDDIKIWDCSGFSMVKQFNPHTNQNVSSAVWSHDNTVIASASTGGDKISLTYVSTEGNYDYDVATGVATLAEFPTVPLSEEGRTCLAFNLSSRYILGGGPDGIIHVWDLKSHKLKKSYRNHKGPVTSIQLNWNDTDIASGSETGEIILYDLVSGQGSIPLTTPRVQAIRQVQYSYFKKSLLGSVSEDGGVNLWDTNRRCLLHSFTDMHKAPATGLAFSPRNEMLLMSVGLDKRIVCYDAQRLDAVKTMMAESPLTSVDLMSDGSTIAVGSTRGRVFIYDLRQGPSPVRTMTAHKASVQCLAFQHKIKGDVGGAPGKSGSSRKANSNNNATSTGKPSNKKAVNGVVPSNVQQEMNGVTSQGLDSRNNNRLDTINSNKETTEFDTVFSPLRDTSSASSTFGAQSLSGSGHLVSHEAAGKGNVSQEGAQHTSFPVNTSIEKYGDGIFSPLADTGSLSSRTAFSAGGSMHASPPSVSQSSAVSYTSDLQGRVAHRNSPAFGSTASPVITASSGLPTQSTRSTAAAAATPGGSSGNYTDFHQSHSDPTMTSSHPADHVTRSASTPASARDPRHPPEDAGAISLSSETRHKPTDLVPVVTTPPEATAAAAAATALDPGRHRSRSRSGSGQGQVGSFQVDLIRSLIDEALEDFREQIRRDVLNLHMDVLKQFHIQQAEMRSLMQQYSVNEDLMAEIERLREENEKLKKKF